MQTYRQNTQGADDERILSVIEDTLKRLEEPLKQVDNQIIGIAHHIASPPASFLRTS
jgi:hypothetical protein